MKKIRFKSNKNQSRPIKHTKQNQHKKSNKPNSIKSKSSKKQEVKKKD
ncbi:hypothetical protein VN1217_14740 [Helicobacter pylori]|nr:hypothetical protein VN1217_14740 [Helicobacter pylori]